ncbi:hypothetical protein [Microbacterium sp.]|uniref:hypothetical protein n=1 Tax=Microbacterium sp. TaxID=51671 RepID=UPI002734D60A|nr:hypothetical protein [Microbacterium sp.]MDP3952040.1 hypothetical protein [Microbacterium sp.]
MDDTQLDKLLSPRDTWAESPELLDAMLVRMAARAEQEHRRPRRRRGARVAAAVGALVGAGVLATAATVYIAPNFTPDAVIPISYVTDTGRSVECSYSLAIRSWNGTDVTAAKAWIASHDWTGIGQRGYDLATQNPLKVGDPDMDPEISQETLDQMMVSTGISTVVVQEIPQDYLDRLGVGTAGTSTCKWELH